MVKSLIDISKKIKKLRIQNGFTQEKFAEICNVSRQAVAKWESGANLPDIEKILQISELFHVTTDELLSNGVLKTQSQNDFSKENRCAENARIINKALKKSMACSNTDDAIRQFISVIGEQIGFDRICIFESVNGIYRNSYEWCNEKSASQMEYLQCIPLTDMYGCLKCFSSPGYLLVERLEDIALSDPALYKWLKPQGIKSILAYPIFGGRGFISIDNPAPAFISQTSSIVEIMLSFVELMMQQRNMMKEWKWEVSQNARFTSCNKAVIYHVDVVTGLVHYDKEQAVNSGYSFDVKDMADLKDLCSRHPEFYDHAVIEGFEKVIETKKNLSLEFISFRDDGRLRWNRISVSPFVDSNGKVLQLYGMLQDISDSHEIIDQYNKYILSMTGGLHICFLSRPVHLEYASDTLCRFLGYSRQEFEQVVGSKYTNLMVEEDREIFRDYAKRLGNAPGIESCKYRLLKKDGTIITVIDTMESILDSSGIMYGYAYVLPETQIHVMLDMAGKKERVQSALVNQQKEVLEIFQKDYLNVFRVWLDEDRTQIVRRKGYVIKDFEKNDPDTFSYYKLCNEYIKEQVHPDDKEKMTAAMHPETVRKAFENNDEYTVIYRTVEDKEIHFFEFKCVRFQKSVDAKKINFIASFKNVDKVMEKQLAYDERLQKKIDVINTIMRAFTCGYFLDYGNDGYEELANSNEVISQIFGKSGSVSKIREKLKEVFPDLKAFKDLDDFLNIDTLNDRLNNQRYATTQIRSEQYGLFELYLFVVDYDEKKNITHGILLVKYLSE